MHQSKYWRHKGGKGIGASVTGGGPARAGAAQEGSGRSDQCAQVPAGREQGWGAQTLLWTGCNGHKGNNTEFHLNTRMHIFPARDQTLGQVAQRACRVSILWRCSNSKQVLDNLFQLSLTGKGVGLDLRRPQTHNRESLIPQTITPHKQ